MTLIVVVIITGHGLTALVSNAWSNRLTTGAGRLAKFANPRCHVPAFCGARLFHSVPAGYDGRAIWSRANFTDSAPDGPPKAPMNARTCLTVVLAAGEGTRMRASRPKVLHAIGGFSLIAHVLAAVRETAGNAAVVVGPGQAEVAAAVTAALPGAAIFVQVVASCSSVSRVSRTSIRR